MLYADTNSNEAVVLWDAHTGALLYTFPATVIACYGITWSPDSMRFAVGGNKLCIWDVASKKRLVQYSFPNGEPFSVAWSPDGRMIAVLENTRRLEQYMHVWDVQSEKIVFTSPVADEFLVGDFAWASDSKRLAIGLKGSLTYLVSVSVQVWDISTEQQILQCQGHWGAVFSIAWSPDGTRFATAGYDRTVQVWNAATGARLLIYQEHAFPVMSVAWSPEGFSLASGDRSGQIVIWDAPSL